jgi:hypothetical protein
VAQARGPPRDSFKGLGLNAAIEQSRNRLGRVSARYDGPYQSLKLVASLWRVTPGLLHAPLVIRVLVLRPPKTRAVKASK